MTDHQSSSSQHQLKSNKIKEEKLQYDLTIEHNNVLAFFYDYYMDFSPKNVKRIFLLFFPLNRLFKLLFIYCLFYHSIWWLPNSTSNNLAINYSNINSIIFTILIYYNFYELIFTNIFLRLICFNLMKLFGLFTLEKRKKILNNVQIFIYLLMNSIIFYYFKFILNISINFLFIIMMPSLFIYIHDNFDFNLKLLNITLLSNQQFIKKLNQNEYQHQPNDNNSDTNQLKQITKLAFTDCSNMSITTFLNQPIPNVLQTNNLKQNKSDQTSSSSTNQYQTFKIIKQSLNRAKAAKFKMLNLSLMLASFPRNLINNLKSKILNKWTSLLKYIQQFILNIPKFNQIKIKKRDFFVYNYSNEPIQHTCQKNAIGLREECNWFSFEFKNRIKHIFLYTFEGIYYNFFITRLFVPQDVYIREKEYYMYLVSSLISTLISYWLYYIPYSFLKTINNNAEHLGYWCRVFDEDQKQSSATKWINTKSYYYGDRVVYYGKIYKANTNHCAAIPSNKFYSIYYLIFSNYARITYILLSLKLFNVALLLSLIYLNRRWYAIALSILEVICNSHLFFILMRDFFISNEKYKYKKL